MTTQSQRDLRILRKADAIALAHLLYEIYKQQQANATVVSEESDPKEEDKI